jgi:hypothetical protein
MADYSFQTSGLENALKIWFDGALCLRLNH